MQEQIFMSGVLILGIFFLRFLFGSHIKQHTKYALWLLVLIKLLLPFISFENPYSVMWVVGDIKDTMRTAEENPVVSTKSHMQGEGGAEEISRNRGVEYDKISQETEAIQFSTVLTDHIHSVLPAIWAGMQNKLEKRKKLSWMQHRRGEMYGHIS